jgi:predicted alpha/beta-fold hydrolase
MIEKERIQQANLATNERIQQAKQRSGDWKLETGEAETIRSKVNEIKKKMGVLRERKRVEGVGFYWV